MEYIEVFLRICIAGFALLLFIPSVLSANRVRQPKLIAVSIAFFILTIKGAVLVVDIFLLRKIEYSPIVACLDFLILLALYYAIVRR